MRAFVFIAFLVPGAALADTIIATSQVTGVTIYPQGALITREVTFTAPAGRHEVLVADMPGATEPLLLRVTSGDTELGPFTLREERLPPRLQPKSPQMVAAEDAVKVAQAALRGAEAKVAAIRAEVEAHQAEIAFLTGVRMDGAASTAEGLASVAEMIGGRVLTARQAALAAEAGLPVAEEVVIQAQDGLDRAQAALEAVSQADDDYVALAVTVTSTGGEGHLVVTHSVYDAGWAPIYDMALDRKGGVVSVQRGVLVSQYSGEDWMGVALTLSTARPSEQSEPTQLWPDLRRIGEPEPEMSKMSDAEGAVMGALIGGVAEAVVEPGAVMSAEMSYQGDTVIYDYPTPVDLASGVENLRLALDEVKFEAKVIAQAVPRLDATAFVVAKVVNSGAEILLPGEAFLYRDGALTGMAQLDAIAPGAEFELGFGAIDGIRLTRDMPVRAEGDRGVFVGSTQIEEQAVLEVENLTGEAWPVRVLDRVPYSEQEDLEITWSADPAPSEADVGGKRGVLAWEFDLAPGAAKEIKLNSLMSWPEGMVLH
jgi:uncharacterized protein (TIGR02231 family)